MQKRENFYFEVKNKGKIDSINQIIKLTKGISYKSPGILNTDYDETRIYPPYTDYGLFRGQKLDWPLIPSSYRKFNKNPNYIKWNLGGDHNEREFYYNHQEFNEFSKYCRNQIVDYPRNFIEQLEIAQHFGIPTPILDWSESIWVALFFGIRLDRINKRMPLFKDFYLYHLPDTKLLKNANDNYSSIYDIDELLLIKPFPIDNRMVRQRSYFTIHPNPNVIKKLVPIHRYKISGKLVDDILLMFRSIGISSEILFPDYAGIAKKVLSKDLIKL